MLVDLLESFSDILISEGLLLLEKMSTSFGLEMATTVAFATALNAAELRLVLLPALLAEE